MVLHRRDTLGPSPLLQGRLLAGWRHVDQAWNLLDAYEIARSREGPRYTRQVLRGDRLDQSRLDRSYITGNADWIHQVVKVKHDGAEGLSDHIPVIITVQYSKPSGRKLKRGSYTKMDAETLRKGDNKVKCQKAWLEGWELTPDPITAWDMAWGRVREIFKEVRLAEREERTTLQTRQRELEEKRVKLAEGQEVDLSEFRKLEEWVHDKELQEGSILRRRSKIRWIENGEASTSYFYNVLKSKQKQEQMTSLTNAEGVLVTDEQEMMGMIQDFYTELYQQPLTLEADKAERSEVLSLIDKRILPEENLALLETPSMEEVETAVKSMAAGKSPGEDGVTVEVVREMWSSIKAGCLAFIQAVWREHRIGFKNAAGKIIATRLKSLIPKLVDDE
ncbi:hypothetical protein R1sor_019621 [Riccia sorocarpa]|uniref:Endonuclease/exonuclease/phosphatase domain-containing protein n=1 Tax=Riccia sorocarpa TaxID=122646 RepID=A0ABD3IJ97_9MARC